MLETPRSVRGRATSRKSTKSISKVNQEIVSSLNSVSDALNRMERGLSSLTRSFSNEMKGMRDDANKQGKDTSDQLLKNSGEAKKAMQSVVKSNEQIVSDFQRSVRRMGNMMKVTFGFFIGTVLIKGIKKATDFMQLNFFDFMTSRIKQIKDLLVSVIPGAEAAMDSLRNMQETMSTLQRTYGMSVEDQPRWRSWVESRVSDIMTANQLTAGVEAIYRANIGGGFERQSQIAEHVTFVAEALGLSLDAVAKSYSFLHDTLGRTQEETLAFFESTNKFAQLSQDFIRSIGVEELHSLFESSSGFIRTLQKFRPDENVVPNMQRFIQTTGQLGVLANIDPQGLMSLAEKATTLNSEIVTLARMDTETVADYLAAGDIEGYYRYLFETIGQVLEGQQSLVVQEELRKILGGDFTSAEWLDMRDLWRDQGQDIIGAIGDAAITSGDSLAYMRIKIQETIPEVERLANQLNKVIYGMDYGDQTMMEVTQYFENLLPQLEAVSSSFSGVGEIVDMLFGPFSFLVKPGINLMAGLAMVGGSIQVLDDIERSAAGPLAGILDLTHNIWNEFLPGMEKFLVNTADVFENWTIPIRDGKSLFQILIERGVDYLTSGEMIGEGGMLTRIFEGLTHVFDTLANEFDRLMTSDFGEKLTEFLTALMRGFAKVLGTMVRAMVPIVTVMLKTMGEVLSDSDVIISIGDFVATLFISIGEAITKNWDNIKAALMPLAMIIWEVLKLGFFGIMTLIAPVIDTITDILNPLGGGTNLAELFQWSSLGSWMGRTGGFGSGTENMLTSAGTSIGDILAPDWASNELTIQSVNQQSNFDYWHNMNRQILTYMAEYNDGTRTWDSAYSAISQYKNALESAQGVFPHSQVPAQSFNSAITELERNRPLTPIGSMGASAAGFLGGLLPSPTSSLPFDITEYEAGTGVTSPYGWRMLEGQLDMHQGVDFGLGAGDIVKAIQGGIVDKIGTISAKDGGGKFIRVLADDGRYWQYNHMNPNFNFNEGDSVQAGDQLGMVGNTRADHLDVKTYTVTGDSRSYDNPENIMKQLGLDFAYQTAQSGGSWSQPSGFPSRTRGDTLQTTSPEFLQNVPETEAGAIALAASLSKDMKRTAEAVEKIVSDTRMEKMDRDLNRAMNK